MAITDGGVRGEELGGPERAPHGNRTAGVWPRSATAAFSEPARVPWENRQGHREGGRGHGEDGRGHREDRQGTGRTVGVTGRTVTVTLLRFAGRWLLYCCTRGHAGLGFGTPDPNYPPGLPQRGGKQVPTDPDLTDDCLGAAGLGSCGLRGGRGRSTLRECVGVARVCSGACVHTRWGGCQQAH